MRTILTRGKVTHRAHHLATTTASGSAIRKNTSHHQGQPCPHPAPLQPHRAAGPQKGQQGPPAVSPRGRHLPPRQQPTGGEQGATGGLARRASGTHPHKTRPKNGNWVLAKKTKGAGGCRRSACVSLAFDLLPVERSEWGIGGGVARRGVLHLCMEKCLIGKARPVAPTELRSEGAVSHLGVHS